MHDFFHLVCHFTGNILMWIFNLGAKSIDEVAKKDNSWIGFMFLVFTFLVLYSRI